MTDVVLEARQQIKEFQDLLLIDKNDLDTALQTQADIYHRVCMEHVFALSRKDQANEALKTIDAQLNLDVRKVFETNGEKATEAKISAEVQLNKKHLDAFEAASNNSLVASMWAAVKDGFHQRAYMLREMAGLYISGYWIGDGNHKDYGKGVESRSSALQGNTTRRVRSDL